MTGYKLNQVLKFGTQDNLPKAVIVGIDLYCDFQAVSGATQNWQSYTLEAQESQGDIRAGEKFYAVALPKHGLCLVEEIKKEELPETQDRPSVDSELSGKGKVVATGKAVQGTGENITDLTTWYDSAAQEWKMFATEAFNGDESERMYFRTTPLKGPVAVVS